jgi:hypothetical protein
LIDETYLFEVGGAKKATNRLPRLTMNQAAKKRSLSPEQQHLLHQEVDNAEIKYSLKTKAPDLGAFLFSSKSNLHAKCEPFFITT